MTKVNGFASSFVAVRASNVRIAARGRFPQGSTGEVPLVCRTANAVTTADTNRSPGR